MRTRPIFETERLIWQQEVREGDAFDRWFWVMLHTVGLPIYLPIMLWQTFQDWRGRGA